MIYVSRPLLGVRASCPQPPSTFSSIPRNIFNQLAASHEQEKVAAQAELEEELVKELCNELEQQAQRQAR